MEDPAATFELSEEQRDTARLLQDVLGRAIADRYADFCRLAGDAFDLKVSRPMAAHALRELESILRNALEVTLGVTAAEDADHKAKMDALREHMLMLKLDENAIDRAIVALGPQNTRRKQIQRIMKRLGFEKSNTITKQWVSLSRNVRHAHERSFHLPLKVNDEFRISFQEPFDIVLRAIAEALRSHYAAPMRRVEALAASTGYAWATESFAADTFGALQIQWHFYNRLTTGDWLPYLMMKGLLGEPLAAVPEEAGDGLRYREWPAGSYLLRMASSTDQTTREHVVAALHKVSGSSHPDILHDGIAIIAALPSEESAAVISLVIDWIHRDRGFQHSQIPIDLVKKLAEDGQSEAALNLARELFRLWGETGRIESHFSQHMYEHHLPLLMPSLLKACGRDALHMVIDLLCDSETIATSASYGHLSSRSIANGHMPVLDIFEALIVAVRQSAETLIKNRAMTMRDIIGMMAKRTPRIFVRISMYVLAQSPSNAPELATSYLMNPELIEATWCNDEYAALALSWFPSLSPDNQTAILGVLFGVPEKHIEGWKPWFEQSHKRPVTSDDIQTFRIGTVAELGWKWRSVMPPIQREAIESFGDPDARRWPGAVPDETPLAGADFARMSVMQIIDYLKNWSPTAELPRQTVTALAQELYQAAGENPKGYAAAADQFTSVKPVYIRRLLESFQRSAKHLKVFDWGKLLKLIAFTYAKSDEQIDQATLSEGDDQSWNWACKAASRLLGTGLMFENSGIPIKCSETVRALVMTALEIVPGTIDVDDFDSKFERQMFYTAQDSSRGLAVELCIRFVHWLSSGGGLPRAAITAQPEIAQALEAQLADRTPNGRIPRAIMGRFLRIMFWCDEKWLQSQMADLFPADDDALRSAAWRSHLMQDGGPVEQLIVDLDRCYLEEAARLSNDIDTAEDNEKNRRHRYASYVMCLVIQGTVPEHVLEQFLLHASSDVRRQAMWFVGTQMSRPLSEVPADARERGVAYWERRLAAARASADRSAFKAEMGTISQWCFHNVAPELWLCGQLLGMIAIGLKPSDGFGILDWLQKVAAAHVDAAAEVLLALIRGSIIDPWAYTVNHSQVRFVLTKGRDEGTPETVARVRLAINRLAAIGADFLDLEPTDQ